VDACKEIGLSRSTFYYIFNREREALSEFQELVKANRNETFLMILETQTTLLQKTIEAAMSDDTKLKDRLVVLKVLDDMRVNLFEALRMDTFSNKVSVETFRGPTLRPGKSTFTALANRQ